MTKQRTAQCACGKVSARTEGEPDLIVLCHCIQCQRRTGSPFGVGVYFKHEAVRLGGATKIFERKVDGTDRTIVNHFCPECGSTVYWTLDLRPGLVGIAAGSFNETDFRLPDRSVWTQHKHDWILVPADIPTYPQAVP